MRHLFLFGLVLTPIMMMAQVEEPQFVLAVPDGSGYLSPRADGELIVSKTPRGTFVLRDAAVGAIGTLPKSAQLIQLYWKGGDDLRAMVGREEWRVGSTADGPGLQMRVHRIDARGDKPKLGPTGALQDGHLVALTTPARRRITRGDGGVITLEPASGNGVFEETQYFRLELRDSETAAREWAALVDRETRMRGTKRAVKKRTLSPEEQAEREQRAIAERRERDAEERRAEAEAEQQRAAEARRMREQRQRQMELQRQRDLQAQREQQQIEYEQQLRARQEQQRQAELQRQRELQAQQEQQRQMEYQRQVRVQQEQQRLMELQRQREVQAQQEQQRQMEYQRQVLVQQEQQRQQQAFALQQQQQQQQQAQLDEQRRRNQVVNQPNNAVQSSVAANTSRRPEYQTGDREGQLVAQPAPLWLIVHNRGAFNIRFSVGGGGMSGSITGGQNGNRIQLLDRSGELVVEFQTLNSSLRYEWRRIGAVPLRSLQQAYGAGNGQACVKATGTVWSPGLSRCD